MVSPSQLYMARELVVTSPPARTSLWLATIPQRHRRPPLRRPTCTHALPVSGAVLLVTSISGRIISAQLLAAASILTIFPTLVARTASFVQVRRLPRRRAAQVPAVAA